MNAWSNFITLASLNCFQVNPKAGDKITVHTLLWNTAAKTERSEIKN